MPSTEKPTQKAILQYLTMRRIFHWKNNTVGIYKKTTDSYIPSQAVGSPDIFAVKDGRIIGIEVKDIKGAQSEHQKAFQAGLEKAGGIYILARSLDDVTC